MNAVDLLSGVAVIIDDEINEEAANIRNLVKQVEDNNIPCLYYSEIPTDEVVSNFGNISFLLLDWRLIKKDISTEEFEEGIRVPSGLQEYGAEENLQFIEKLKERCFCPIFIFSNEDQEEIIAKLEEADLYSRERPGNIFVRSKNDLKGRTRLFKELTKWLNKAPSVYVLKEWEKEYRKAKNELFHDFQDLSPHWPKVLWKNSSADGVNQSLELGEVISRNLSNRMAPFEFSPEVLEKRGNKIPKEEMANVLEGERFLPVSRLREEDIAPGDIFKVKSRYYVNIRAACDCIPDRGKMGSTHDDVEVYLLRGSKLGDAKIYKVFNKKYGHFPERDNESIVFPVCGGLSVSFSFKNVEVKKWGEVKDKRVGRLLAPHITKIQQRYALYMQRQGLPRIPNAAVIDN
ncbi:hypothetical protein [uncultured Pseudodesulfovibrio sp.]|uniref:hypothetical protein n=1 Tax=uncultured Pseudodesulfovibrio sp. TaxID=2035858 RepID=UPI0029C8EF2D|nr:hypothetical protein [uncultured Pseudodesulfovibrio sp.]